MKRSAILLAGLCALPSAAHAHLVATGFGAYYDGVVHLALTPADLLVVIGLALLGGLRGKAAARPASLALPLAWLAGGFIGMNTSGSHAPLWLAFSFGVVGALVALDLRVSREVVVGLACAIGMLHGYVNGATLATGEGTLLTLIGVASAVWVLITLLPAIAVSLQQQWMRIAMRVAGSWIGAIAILTVGWMVKGSAL